MYSRLNIFRFFLAWSVLAYHSNIFSVPFAGPIAVWCFFFISGFLVSNILYERYQGRPKDFLINRFLRLYPTYWAALLLGIALATIDPEGVSEIIKVVYIPQDYASWLQNLFIFNLTDPPRLVAPAWSLAIELNWYLILFVASFLPKKWVVAFLCINLAVPFVVYFLFNQSIPKLGAGFAFALGALAYHSSFKAPRLVQYIALLAIPVVMYVLPVKLSFGWLNIHSIGVTFSLIGTVVLLYIAMPLLTEKTDSSRWASFMGDLSYPLFLVHQYAIWLVVNWFGINYFPSWSLVLGTTLVSLILSAAIVFVVERPIAEIRSKVRNR